MATLLDLTFRLISGQGVNVRVPSDKLIADIKILIAAECGITPGTQRLIFKGQLLADDRTIGSYNIETGSTIHVIGNSTGASQQTQGQSYGNSSQFGGRPPMNFGEAMASSMGSLMRDFLTKPGNTSSPFSNLTAAFAEGAFQNGASQQGGSDVDWINAAGGTDELLRQGMQIAQQLGGSNGNLGEMASKLFSGMMGNMMNPGGNRESSYTNTNFTATSAQPAKNRTDLFSSKSTSAFSDQDIKSTVVAAVAAKHNLDAICDALDAGQKSDDTDQDFSSDASKKLLSICNESIMLSTVPGGIVVDDCNKLKSLLPWKLLHKLEMTLGVMEYHNIDKQDISDFLQRWRDAQTRAHDTLAELEHVSQPSQKIDTDKLTKIAIVCSLQAAINSALALVTTVMSNKAKVPQRSVDAKSSTPSPKVTKEDHASSRVADVRQGLTTSSISTMANTGSTSSSSGLFPEAAARQVQRPAGSYSSDNEILADTTWLRRQLSAYRNSTGFKSRMDELIQKTKKLSNIYCTGTLPK
ncbi:ubiquitin family domain containing protein [Babesia ovis]|uniref:Ubiquitin family domain containing protein n=1 Tax=Babesia ovis TaxID=5869 RepID=A0A9W5TD48_BABOV|nr:ubiquitin family domain containing protein [Babesia ovis]